MKLKNADLTHELPSMEVALDHLDWAIRLLADHDALVPAYTLAGVAEEMIGKRVQGNALSQMRQQHPEEDFNSLRNFLKHGTVKGIPVEIVEVSGMKQEVALIILRAFENLRLYDNSVCSEGIRFRKWLYECFPELFERLEQEGG